MTSGKPTREQADLAEVLEMVLDKGIVIDAFATTTAANTIGVPATLITELGEPYQLTEREQTNTTYGPRPVTTASALFPDTDAPHTIDHDAATLSRLIHGFTPNDTDAYTLSNLELAIASDDTANTSPTISLGHSPIPELPMPVSTQWQPAGAATDTTYEWYHPRAGVRLTVSHDTTDSSDSYTTSEYTLTITNTHDDEPEHVLATPDETTITMAVIDHMNGIAN